MLYNIYPPTQEANNNIPGDNESPLLLLPSTADAEDVIEVEEKKKKQEEEQGEIPAG